MSSIISTSRLVIPKSSGLSAYARRSLHGFSLVEVVAAIAIASFALISIVGLLSVALVTHQDSANDSVMTLMTESALLEMRNVGFTNIDPTKTYYLYFDADGQITADFGGNGSSSTSYEVTASSAASAAGTPLTTPLGNYPANTVYQCSMTIQQTTLAQGTAVSPSLYLIKLQFAWPVYAAAASQKSQLVKASISNSN